MPASSANRICAKLRADSKDQVKLFVMDGGKIVHRADGLLDAVEFIRKRGSGAVFQQLTKDRPAPETPDVDQQQSGPTAPASFELKRRFAVMANGEIVLQTNSRVAASDCWEKSGPTATILERSRGTPSQERRSLRKFLQPRLEINPLADKLRERHQETVDRLNELLDENICIIRPTGLERKDEDGSRIIHRTATNREAATGEIKVEVDDFSCDFRRDIPGQIIEGLERIRAELTANINRIKRAVKRGELPCPKLLYWQVIRADGTVERCKTGGLAHKMAHDYGEGAKAVPVYQTAKG